MSEKTSAAERLKELREETGVGVREMARRLGISVSSYQHYENPDRFKRAYLPTEFAAQVATALKDEGRDIQLRVMALATGGMSEGTKPYSVVDGLVAKGLLKPTLEDHFALTDRGREAGREQEAPTGTPPVGSITTNIRDNTVTVEAHVDRKSLAELIRRLEKIREMLAEDDSAAT